MRRIKAILFIICGLVVVFLITIGLVLLTFDNDDYKRLVIRGVAHFTGYNATIDGPFALTLSSQPSLSAQGIRLDSAPGQEPPPVTKIGKLRIRIALWPLLTRILVVRELLVEDAVVAVTLGKRDPVASGRRSSRKSPPNINLPIIEHLRLINMRLDVIHERSHGAVDIRLGQFTIDEVHDAGPLLVAGNGSISGTPFRIDGRLGSVAEIFGGAGPYTLDLTIRSRGLTVSASGTVENVINGKGLTLGLSAEAVELSNVFKMLKIEAPPLEFKFQATVTRDLAAPRVSDLSISLSGEDRLDLAVQGIIDNAVSGTGADLQISGSCANPEVLAWLLPANLPELQRVRLSGRLRDTPEAQFLEDLTVRVDATQGLSASAGGRVGLAGGIAAPHIKNVDVDILLSMPTPDSLQAIGFDSPPDVGPLTVRGRLTGPSAHLALEEFLLETNGSGPLRMTSRGRIGRLPARLDAGVTVSEIDLNATLQADHTGALNSSFGLNLLEFGAVSLTARMRGASNQFQLDKIDGRSVSPQGLEVFYSGRVDVASHPENGRLVKPDIHVNIVAPSVAAAFAPLGVTYLPDLKPVQGAARIAGDNEVLTVRQITVRTGHSGPVRMAFTGDIERIPLGNARPPSGVMLNTSVSADSMEALAAIFGLSMPDFGSVHGAGRIDKRSGTYGIRDVNLVIGDETRSSLKMTGHIASVLNVDGFVVDGIDLTAIATKFRWHPILDFFGSTLPDVGPMSGRFQIAGNPARLAVTRADVSTVSAQGLTITATGDIRHVTFEEAKPITGIDIMLEATAPGLRALPGLADRDLPDLGLLQLKAAAAGRMDLGTETVDVYITARPRRRFIPRERSAVRITGSLSDPSLNLLSLSDVGRLSGELLMSPVFVPKRLIGKLWFLMRGDPKPSPCVTGAQ